MKPYYRNSLLAASLCLASLGAHAAPLSIFESQVCAPDAGGDADSACFVLPGISAFTVLGNLTPEGSSELDLSDFLQFSGLLAEAGYSYSFSQTGESAFGFFYDAASVLEVFDAGSANGNISADAGGNLFAAVFLEDSATASNAYSLTVSPVPVPATAGLLGLGLFLAAGRRFRRF